MCRSKPAPTATITVLVYARRDGTVSARIDGPLGTYKADGHAESPQEVAEDYVADCFDRVSTWADRVRSEQQ